MAMVESMGEVDGPSCERTGLGKDAAVEQSIAERFDEALERLDNARKLILYMKEQEMNLLRRDYCKLRQIIEGALGL